MRFLFTTDFGNISYGLGRALQELGHKVCIVNLSTMFSNDPSSLSRLLTDFKPDFAVSDGGWYNFWDTLAAELTRLGIPHIYWAREDPVFFDSLSLPYSQRCQYVFTTADECIPRYESNGIAAGLMMFACLPSFHHQVKPEGIFMHDLILIGTNFARFDTRETGINIILRPLVSNGYDIMLYGNEWWLDKNRPFSVEAGFYGGHLEYETTRTAYSSARIVLGIHSVDTSPTMMSMRTFEILGCGAFFLTQWTPAVENLFKNHVHLVWAKSPEETLDLVNYYLAHADQRKKIARQGQQEVYANHTYLHRARELLKAIKPSNDKISRAYSIPFPGTILSRPTSVKRITIANGKPGSSCGIIARRIKT